MDIEYKYNQLHTEIVNLEHPRVLLNILSHGNEVLGEKVAKKIQKLLPTKGSITIHTANEMAYKENTRFIDTDLNRSFPGNLNGGYEEKLAYKMTEYIKNFDYLIDIHATVSGLQDTLIIEDYSSEVEGLLSVCTAAKYVLHMEATKGKSIFTATRLQNRIIPSIAFEYGNNDDETTEKTYSDVVNILKKIGVVEGEAKKRETSIDYFSCYSVYPKKHGDTLSDTVQNYTLVKKGEVFARAASGEEIFADEDFYPVLFGESNYKDFFGFKAKKLR